MRFDSFHHFSHEHEIDGVGILIPCFCSMCTLPIPRGLDCYWCYQCRFYVHIECAELPEHIDHSLHSLHSLKLAKRSLDHLCRCCYCDKPFQNDEYVYACGHQSCSDFYMHMTCAMIPLPTITSNELDHGVVQFSCHQQPMTLVDHSDKWGAKCFGCQLNWSGSAYSCISEKCENFLHKSCAELPWKIQHPFHSAHSLILQVSKPRSCRSCCRKDCRLVFTCHEDGCNFTLGTECASLDITVNCRSHDHLLSLVEKSSCEIQCDACQKSYENEFQVIPNEVNHTRSLLFRCMECVSNFHFLCGPLPSTIKYEYHMHPLILFDPSVFKDDPDESCCDVCEEEMNQSFRFYSCEDCKFVAHIHCLIYEITKEIKKDTKEVKLKILGDSRWDWLDTESMDHQSREISSESTLKEIIDILTEQEKKMLIDPFAFNDPIHKVNRKNSYNEYRHLNSNFDREGSIKDIDRIKRFFHFNQETFFFEGVEDFETFLVELQNFTPEEGLLKLDDKYLRQKIEDVDGYMVPKTLAPVLKATFHKYGNDFVGKDNSTPAMKSITSTLLCIVIDEMCRTKVEDITKDDLRHWYFYLTGIQKTTGFVLARFVDSFEELLEAFLGFEAIRYEKGIHEELDHEMAMLEARMERLKENREKLKRDTSDMSDFMRTCSKRASEWKHRNWGDKWF